MDIDEFVKFLDLSEDERLEYYINNPHWNKLHWWGKWQIKYLNKWWTSIRECDSYLSGYTIWQSIYKRRF